MSIVEKPDIETSTPAYAERFAGPVGEWMLQVQERIALGMIARREPGSILDVGGCHGQLSRPLCRAGYSVTVLGSDPSCQQRIQDDVDAGRCQFVSGSLTELPFEDDAFDTVISFRMLTHCTQWKNLVSELCRVARHSVIVDYPTRQSVNVMAPALFEAKRRIEKDTRRWTLFNHTEIRETFAENGYGLGRKQKQFFLPMVLHRMINVRGLSVAGEGVARALGLTMVWGSPVIVEMVPNGDGGDGRSKV